jgi:DNA-binding GntR family transcriptional regulator
MGVRTARVGRRVLREEVKEYLIAAILRAELQSGDRIIESRVAQQLGVSQGPVREALRDLELFGFVVSSPFCGAQVRHVSVEDLVQVYPIRAALEGVAARAAATRVDEATLGELETILGSMREAAARGDGHGHAAADIAFHQAIVAASGNGLLLQFWDSMHLATTTFITSLLAQRSLQDLAERHEPVLAALRARDPQVAEHAMRRHIEELGEWILEAAEAERGRDRADGPTEEAVGYG